MTKISTKRNENKIPTKRRITRIMNELNEIGKSQQLSDNQNKKWVIRDHTKSVNNLFVVIVNDDAVYTNTLKKLNKFSNKHKLNMFFCVDGERKINIYFHN